MLNNLFQFHPWKNIIQCPEEARNEIEIIKEENSEKMFQPWQNIFQCPEEAWNEIEIIKEVNADKNVEDKNADGYEVVIENVKNEEVNVDKNESSPADEVQKVEEEDSASTKYNPIENIGMDVPELSCHEMYDGQYWWMDKSEIMVEECLDEKLYF